jgi:TolA-binding protein
MMGRWFTVLPALAVSLATFGGALAQEAASDQPRRDPKGIKGISPFWELIKRGDDAIVARDFDSAIQAYRDALTKEPQNPMGHYRMGEAQLLKGDMKEARAAWESAKRFAGEQHALKAKILFVLADLSERERELADATNGWTGYAQLAKQHPEAKTYPNSAADRQKRIEIWKKLEVAYAPVKERIEKRLKEVDENAAKNAK